jgi:hypothetical protein
MKSTLFLSGILSIVLGFSACKDRNGDPCASDFDQAAMLQNVGNNIILPRYTTFNNLATQLKNDIDSFTAAPDAVRLATVRLSFVSCYLSYQRVAIFEFGPAETIQFRNQLNNFPLFTNRVAQVVVDSASYNLELPYFEYARGLPAVDYLLFGIAANDADIIAAYTTATEAAARKQYLRAVGQHIAAKSANVYDAWRSDGGNYLLTFTTNTGVATGTSLSFLVNQLSQNYELVKNNKIGTPIGAKVSYIASPEKVEALYSGISLDLALVSVRASKNLFLGITEVNSENGQGLDDYLNAVEAARDEVANPLAATISGQFDLATTQLEALRPLGTFRQAIISDINATKLPYAAVANQIVYLKTDLPSLLCVSITYSDITDDGD